MKILGHSKYLILGLVAAASLLTSCKPRLIFTEANRQQLENKSIDMTRVQFYTDKELILRRKDPTGNTKVSKGEIKVVDGEMVEEIRIPRGTPGIVTDMDAEVIFVAFDNCDDCSLRFEKNKYDAYQVGADKWLGKRGQVQYDNKTFYLTAPHHDALLMVKKREIIKDSNDSRIAKGRRIDDDGEDQFRRVKKNETNTENFDEDPSWDGAEDDWENDNWEEEDETSGE